MAQVHVFFYRQCHQDSLVKQSHVTYTLATNFNNSQYKLEAPDTLLSCGMKQYISKKMFLGEGWQVSLGVLSDLEAKVPLSMV